MDYYLVSVFQNLGHTAVLELCDRGRQKLSLRNDLFVWAIAHHENALAEQLITRCDVHHNNCVAIKTAVRHNNAHMLDVLLQQPAHTASLYSRFVSLLELSACDFPLLPTLANSFSHDAFEQMSQRIIERIQWQEEFAGYEIEHKSAMALAWYKQAQTLRAQLHTAQQLRTEPLKPKM